MAGSDDNEKKVADDKEKYIPDDGLKAALEVAMDMQIPLFLTGEPGTGKTMLAYWVAQNEEYQKKYGIDPDVLRFNVKTTTIAKDLLYRYDAIKHFRDSRRDDVDLNTLNYIYFEALGQSIITARKVRRVVLVDEIDKAPRDLPNDLLYEFEKLGFRIDDASDEEINDENFDWKEMPSLKSLHVGKPEFNEQNFIQYASKAEQKSGKVKRPVLILTSNSEKNLPDAFLRRCAFYHIPFPEDKDKLLKILTIKGLYDPKKQNQLTEDAVEFFLGLRQKAGLRKKPATAELITWVELLHSIGISPKNELTEVELQKLQPTLSLLGKNKEDLDRIVSQLKVKNTADK